MTATRSLRRRAFTLLELVVVVALVGLMASLVGVRVASSSAVQQERAALQAMVDVLATTRVEAMRRGEMLTATLTCKQEQFAVDGPGMHRLVEAQGLIAIDDRVEPVGGHHVDFDGAGRTLQRMWWFVNEDVQRTELLNANLLVAPWEVTGDAPARDVQGRVWRIVFDPVSGAPRVERVDGQGRDDR